MFTPPYDASTSRASSISNALTRTRHTASALALMMSLMACQSTQSTSESPQTAQPQGERAQREQSRDVTPQSEKRLDSNALSKATATTAAPKSEPQRATPTESAEAVASSGDASGRSLNAQAGATLALGAVGQGRGGGGDGRGGGSASGESLRERSLDRFDGSDPERDAASGPSPAASPQEESPRPKRLQGATTRAQPDTDEAKPDARGDAEDEPPLTKSEFKAKRSKPKRVASGFLGSSRRARKLPQRYKIKYSDGQLRSMVHGSAQRVDRSPISTFSMDVDTTSYTRLRSAAKHNKLLPANEVKIEGFINAFPYELDAPPAESDLPLSVTVELSAAPWRRAAGGDQLLRLSLQARDAMSGGEEVRASSNLVFLVDVSGSMRSRDKLPLVKRGLERLIKQLKPQDKVSLVTYSGEVKTLLRPTLANRRGKRAMRRAFRRLRASGATAGGAGLERAYELALEGFIEEGNNRILVATDGDFNVGISSVAGIKDFISEKRSTGVYLSMLGFGHKNYSDANMGALAKSGNGNYVFIDTLEEADRALRVELEGLLNTVAHDIKLQVEFNPEHVTSYRLLGYRQRRLAAADFANDQRDSAELGAGQQVTALYELWTPYLIPEPRVKVSYPCGDREVAPNVDCPDRKGDETPPAPDLSVVREWGKLKLRFKRAVGEASEEVAYPISGPSAELKSASLDHRAAVALALFAEGQRSIEYPLSAYQYAYSRWGLNESTLVKRESHAASALLTLIRPQRGESVSQRQRAALKDLRALIKSTERTLRRSMR